MPVDRSLRTPVRRGALVLCLALATAAAVSPIPAAGVQRHQSPRAARAPQVIPKPAHETAGRGHFTLTARTRIVAPGAAGSIGRDLARALRPATGYPLQVLTAPRPAR